ncbi:Sodium:proton antiporter [Rubrivivax sp. A210]|uniref:cation:proton antiporter n=1 Tax=Rubrivivax sp. A210 TaxID=2772301 RepID=UPI001919A4C2|nr:cation:proton antiporter [Rubrivivax sp. A210]CAD5365984.1 Sodium:proton antiporter [Rubrivivax sp. A210]
MTFALWLTVGGALLLIMVISGSMLSRLPVSTSMLYLLAGLVIGPLGLALASPRLADHVVLLEHLTEVIVLLSLFTSGMKMSLGLNDQRWFPPLRLALGSMVATVVLISVAGVALLGLPVGAAVLLGGILAPTDPVLATEVQVDDPADRDQLRFALTGEGGLNDGTAFPVVMLGLGLLGAHELGTLGWRWLAVDVLWATGAGLAIGAALGTGLGRLVLYLRHRHHEATGYENFLALGLIALAYGLAVLAQAYGFLAVFAAGLALRHSAKLDSDAAVAALGIAPSAHAEAAAALSVEHAHHSPLSARAEQMATDPRHASAYMAHAVLSFNEQLDRIGEMAGVVVVGLLLWAVPWMPAALWFVPLMLLVVRPLSVAAALAGSRISPSQRRLIAWFGIRGIGSLYYLSYAINHGLPAAHVDTVVALTLAVVVSSIVLHGISVTPLMARYRRRRRGAR